MSGKRTPPDWSWIRGCEFYDLSVLDDGSRGYEWLAYWRTKHGQPPALRRLRGVNVLAVVVDGRPRLAFDRLWLEG
jgi:hypothetical protein